MPIVDPTILQRAVDGESRAIEPLLYELRPLIERQLLRYPISDEDRRDLLQVTLIRVMRGIESFRGDSNFATWIYRVTANEALMLMRAQRRHRSRVVDGIDVETFDVVHAPLDGEHGHDGDRGAVRSQRTAWIRDAIANMSKSHRDVLIAHYHLDLGLHEIAHRLALSEAAVRSRLHRARRLLRAKLADTPLATEVLEETTRPRRAA